MLQETDLQKLERLAYLKDEDPSYTEEWRRLRDKLWSKTNRRLYSSRNMGVWVFFPNGERKTFVSKREVKEKLGINHRTINEYIDSDIPVKQGNSKGCYFYSLAKEGE